MIDTASIENLKNTIDIVDVIGNYIELKKSGANYKACCPFHGEKTASFVVSPNKQIYHCFGCGVGGDSIKFVMELEKLTYPEAVEKIASNFNFTLHYTEGKGDYSEGKRALEALELWYQKNLTSRSEVLKYLQKRGVSQNSIEQFGVGFVGDGKDVVKFLESTLVPFNVSEEIGVLAKGEGGIYARLTERITFPIYNQSGAIVGFGGRTISNHPAKYINSPQTKLFNKSKLLYGYNVAKEHIYANKKIIITEGYLDVIMLHQGGFKEAVATLGTALTNEHLPLLRKGDPKIVLAYDGDKAGVAAALKAATMLSIAGFDGGVVLFPDNADPADLIAKNQTSLVTQLFREQKPLVEFVIQSLASEFNLSNPKEKESAFDAIKGYMSGLSDIIKDAYTSYASSVIGVPISLFQKGQKKNFANSVGVQSKEDTAKLCFIKSLLEYPDVADMVGKYIHPSMFGEYQSHYDVVCNNDKEHELARMLSLREDIMLIDKDEMQKSIKDFLLNFYEDRLKIITNDKNISTGSKMVQIRKLKMDILPRLKKGELVEYEGIGII
ncbi:MAG: DNA primase [Sulfurovaceae bacterium]|nr:DNA primase [Sulfurovaceae bacterium]MDD5548994.1 DNA primase [Sulfurovaceae bacterium]